MEDIEGETNVLTNMQKVYSTMSGTEKKIADFILAYPQKTVNMILQALAKNAGVSEGSVVNFANRMGFEGYTALKISIAQSMNGYNQFIFNDVEEKDSPKDALKKVMENAITSFQSTYTINQESVFQAATDLFLTPRRRIEFHGIASSSMIALDAYYRFLRLGFPAVAVTDGMICSVSADMLDEQCLVVAISHSGQTDDIVKAAGIAKKRGASILSVTSGAESPLAKLSDVCLLVASKETETGTFATASRMSHLLILDALCAYVGLQNKENSLAKQVGFWDIVEDHYKTLP